MTKKYPGSELEVFAHANNWKRYVAKHVEMYLKGDVLEVGSGTGSATRVFCTGVRRRWVCLEPDADLSSEARRLLCDTLHCEFMVGEVGTLPADEMFDAILYMDVLEHIADDNAELVRASRHLRPSGVIWVLAPAHQFLYSEFDKAIGHFRRYNKPMLSAMNVPGLKLERLSYLDSCGLFASAMNRLFLRIAQPTLSQILFWDRVLVPVSKIVDPLIRYSAGKSVLAIWRMESVPSRE